uniref:Uncharacterized protein n=1 Tax=Chenopodium quinoa TaxID=63459 RepID=A0A803N1C1_CHEQI
MCRMSEYENVIAGKLRLKGKALDVKAGGIAKKKKHRKNIERIEVKLEERGIADLGSKYTIPHIDVYYSPPNLLVYLSSVVSMLCDFANSHLVEINTEKNVDGGNEVSANYDERLTPAERRFLEQWKHLEVRRLLKSANESHRDRVQRFNQYLANLSDHYDIPKVGPG